MHTTPEYVQVPQIRSLVWEGACLVDWLAGGRKFERSGRITDGGSPILPDFDHLIVSPSGRFSIAYCNLGTSAVLLERGQVARELSRSDYHADAYEYPVSFIALPDGSEAILHCPKEYCRLDIELAESGRCLTDSVDRKPEDFFHSRLSQSPDNAYVASAGWVWHPAGDAGVQSLRAALSDPTLLDRLPTPKIPMYHEVEGFAFLRDGRFVMSIDADTDNPQSTSGSIVISDFATLQPLHSIPTPSPCGTLLRVSPDRVLSLFGHPRLWDLSRGGVVAEWPELKTGTQRGSIISHIDPVPICSLNVELQLLAVVQDSELAIVDLSKAG